MYSCYVYSVHSVGFQAKFTLLGLLLKQVVKWYIRSDALVQPLTVQRKVSKTALKKLEFLEATGYFLSKNGPVYTIMCL